MSDLQIAQQLQDQYDGSTPLKNTAGVAYSIVASDYVIDLMFLGTSDLEDAKRDLEAGMISTAFGQLHRGAWSGLLEVFSTEEMNLPKNKPIRISGPT